MVADDLIRSGATRAHAVAASSPRHALAGAGVVYHGAHLCCPQAFREDRLECRLHRSVRDHERSRSWAMAAIEELELGHERVNGHGGACALVTRWCFRRTHHGDALVRSRASWIETRHRGALHRRARSDCNRPSSGSFRDKDLPWRNRSTSISTSLRPTATWPRTGSTRSPRAWTEVTWRRILLGAVFKVTGRQPLPCSSERRLLQARLRAHRRGCSACPTKPL